MKIGVTGAGGFVGRHLAVHLHRQGHDVLTIARGAPVIDDPAIKHLQTDLRDLQEIGHRLDCLVHCAAVIPARCADGEDLITQNRQLTANAVNAAVSAGAHRVIYLSSMAVYGVVEDNVVDHETRLVDPAPYGVAKLEGETLSAEICRTAQIDPPVSLRLPGVVGAGSHDNFLSGAMARILKGESVTARNPDALFNNILFVDHLNAFIADLIAMEDWPDRPMAFPLASRNPIPIGEVLTAMFKGADRNPDITWQEPPGHSFLIDFSQAKSLGFEPRTVEQSVASFVRAVCP